MTYINPNVNELEKNYREGIEKKLLIRGRIETYKTFLIPIGDLYFNNENGRISTFIQEYKAANKQDLNELMKEDLEKYNEIVGEFVRDSANDSGASYRDTKQDIARKGQLEPGVILPDGRVIDGNRRFCVIRELFYKGDKSNAIQVGDPRFAYFECAVLDVSLEGDEESIKQDRSLIKALELNLQFNTNEKEEYDPIDLLNSFYDTTMNPETKCLTKEEYIFQTGISENKYNSQERTVNAMLDYLKWRGYPGAFYLLKREKLDGPMVEFANKLTDKKVSRERQTEIKENLYPYMTLVDEKDRTRVIRELLNSAINHTALYSSYTNQLESDPELLKKVNEASRLKNQKCDTPEEEMVISEAVTDAKNKLIDIMNTAKYAGDMEDNSKQPIDKMNKALELLTEVNRITISKSNSAGKYKINQAINKIEKELESIRASAEDEES